LEYGVIRPTLFYKGIGQTPCSYEHYLVLKQIIKIVICERSKQKKRSCCTQNCRILSYAMRIRRTPAPGKVGFPG